MTPEFQEIEIDKLSEFELQVFEELFIQIPLNYIYWRDGVKYEQLFPTTDQDGDPICWAHAIATIIILATRRIIGREAPKFEDIKKELIQKYGCHKNDSYKVLKEILPKYGLHFSEVPEDKVDLFNEYGSYMFYISCFYLPGEKWNDFSNFFDNPENKQKNNFLKSKDLCITKPNDIYRKNDGGHAVVCIDQNSSFLTYLNSWGNDWGIQGKFSMERGAISNIIYYSVYFLENELTNEEKHCNEKRQKEAIDAFYQIIYNMKLSNFQSIQSDAIIRILNNESLKVINEVKKILFIFCENYWKQGKDTIFLNLKLSFITTIKEFNTLQLNEQLCVIERIMDYLDNKKKKFLLKIKNLLSHSSKEYNITKPFIEISSKKYEYLIDIKDEQDIILSKDATNYLFYQKLIKDLKLIDLMNEFDNFLIILKYPDESFQEVYGKLLNVTKQLSNNNIKIGIFYEDVKETDTNFCDNKNISYIKLDSTVTTIIGRGDFGLRKGSFSFCTSLTHIEIPSSVTYIFDYALSECTSLKEISLPSSIERIGKYAFFNCSSLEKIAIPPHVEYIESWTFAGCSSLKKITIFSSLGYIGYFAFAGCSSLEQILIPNSVRTIKGNAFSGCSSLRQIFIPASVESIGCCAFEGCTLLNEVLILSQLTYIRYGTFKNCISLQNVSIPQSVKCIEDYAFSGCKSLKEIEIHSFIKSIGSYAFKDCASLTKIQINSSLTSIEKGTFSGCSRLKEINIPSSVKIIKMSSFKECSLLEKITFEDESNLNLIENYAFYKCKSLKQISIPFSVISIESHAFYECTSLSSVLFDKYSCLKSIGIYAFYNCLSLKDIELPGSLVSIGNYAFIQCSSLEKIKFLKGYDKYNFKYMGINVFDNCSSLETLEIPHSISHFGENTFDGCSSMKRLVIPLSCISLNISKIDEKINIEIIE